jgi:membrane protease YdiL (CAAX protease family)
MTGNSVEGRHPFVFVGLMIILVASLLLLAGGITSGLRLPEIALYLMSNGTLAAVAAVMLSRMGWWKAIGFRPVRRLWHFLLFLVPSAPVVLNFLGFVPASFENLSLFLALAILVGFVEEAFFRGLMLRPLALLGRWRAAIATSLIFGLMHGQHMLRGTDPEAVLMQMGFETSIGFTYAALVLRTGTIWPLIIIHFLTDFGGFAASGEIRSTIDVTLGPIGVLIYCVVFVGYGALLLWKRSGLEYYSIDSPNGENTGIAAAASM